VRLKTLFSLAAVVVIFPAVSKFQPPTFSPHPNINRAGCADGGTFQRSTEQ
jgi:hypothetical protein